MAGDRGECGPLHRLYTAARSGDAEGMTEAWKAIDFPNDTAPQGPLEGLEAAVEAGNAELARRLASELLFEGREEPALEGLTARLLGALLYGFGYLASFVLFARARSAETVVTRLRWAYRRVGVDVIDTETADGLERTTFRCPYREIGAGRWGNRRACHDVLDLVDDGYVDWLSRYRDIDYRRPRACAVSECCYSEVSEQ